MYSVQYEKAVVKSYLFDLDDRQVSLTSGFKRADNYKGYSAMEANRLWSLYIVRSCKFDHFIVR